MCCPQYAFTDQYGRGLFAKHNDSAQPAGRSCRTAEAGTAIELMYDLIYVWRLANFSRNTLSSV